MMNFEQIAKEQAIVIESLSKLCSDLISELSLYRSTDYEEEMLAILEDKRK